MSRLKDKLFDEKWSYHHRNDIIQRLKTIHYDVFVIGGGITGAGVAREASMRGLKVALVDMQDFSAGTSSRSSKLAHGGIRYLAYGEMDLVKHATRERNWMRVQIPHLVRPIPFLFVSLKGGKYKKRDIMGAVRIYDYLSDNNSEFKNYKKHKWYKPEEIYNMEPYYIREGNLGGAVYYDNNVDDARLTIETLKEAVVRNADILNYCKVIDYIKENNVISGVKCIDVESNEEFEVKAKLVVNATGIWVDTLINSYPENLPKPLIRPTKGVHVQFLRKHVKNNMATIIRSRTDDRSFFVLPRNKKYTLIGTTDTDYRGDLENPFCNKEDVDYLLNSVKYYFPEAELDYKNILSTYAGIRPLVMQKGKSESEVSREHLIFSSDDGLLTITGGKLTEWRQMAEDLLSHIIEMALFPEIEREEHFSRQPFLVSLEREKWLGELERFGADIDEDIADHLYQQYGRGAIKILELIKVDESLKEKIVEENDFIKAEIVYILKYELLTHLFDVFCRRTEMSLWIKHERVTETATIVADIMSKEFSWSEERKQQEINECVSYIKRSVNFITKS